MSPFRGDDLENRVQDLGYRFRANMVHKRQSRPHSGCEFKRRSPQNHFKLFPLLAAANLKGERSLEVYGTWVSWGMVEGLGFKLQGLVRRCPRRVQTLWGIAQGSGNRGYGPRISPHMIC